MNLYRIGEASARSGIPASTLRYYDQIGLLRPANPDAANQYRYYSDDDITRMKIIQHLRQLDFTIEEVRFFLREGNHESRLHMLQKKKQEVELKRMALLQMEQEVDRRIQSIEQELASLNVTETKEWTISVRKLPDRPLLSRRTCLPRGGIAVYQEAFTELLSEYRAANLSIVSLLLQHHHIDLNKQYDCFERSLPAIDLEVGFLLSLQETSVSNAILPGGIYGCIQTKGMAGKERFEKLYVFIQKWLKENAYEAEGPLIDILLTDFTHLSNIDYTKDILTETQFRIVPTKKVKQSL